MPADRFFYPGPLLPHSEISFEDSEHHHLRVMRIAAGEEIDLVNGKGDLAQATLLELGKKEARCIINYSTHAPNLLPQFSLAVPLMRPSKLEWIVEKGTELGADHFLFYPADYSEKAELSNNQIERLRHLCISALKQSGRLYLPSFEILSHIEDLWKTGLPIYFGDTNPSAPPLANPPFPLLFATGPERGFSPKETQLLSQKATGVRIHPHILRAETAPLAAAAILAQSAFH